MIAIATTVMYGNTFITRPVLITFSLLFMNLISLFSSSTVTVPVSVAFVLSAIDGFKKSTVVLYAASFDCTIEYVDVISNSLTTTLWPCFNVIVASPPVIVPSEPLISTHEPSACFSCFTKLYSVVASLNLIV